MKCTNIWIALLLAVCVAAADEISPEFAKKVRENAESLDQLLQSPKPIKGSHQQKMDLKAMIPGLAALLKLEPDTLFKLLLESQYKLSGLSLARLIADKTDRPFDEVLKGNPDRDWLAALAQAGIPLSTAAGFLDHLYEEVSFMKLDSVHAQPRHKK